MTTSLKALMRKSLKSTAAPINMTKETFELLEGYMLSCMEDSAHDKQHIYRVLYNALEIAAAEPQTDYDILIAACLLHDIGRKEQFENPALCHAQVGAKKAYDFLTANGFGEGFAGAVSHCISTHRFRSDNQPKTLEAKILFDADKLDASGTMGVARTLLYNGAEGEPLYSVDENGYVLDGTDEETPSFFQEYKFKLEKLYSRFLTEKGQELANERRASAVSFYESMLAETKPYYESGKERLKKLIAEESR